MLCRILFFLIILAQVWAEDGPGSLKCFVVIETTVQRAGQEVSSKNPQERRWYISNLVDMPQPYPGYTLRKMADEYFTAQVVNKLKAQGLQLNYYDNNVEINDGAVYAMNSDQDVEQARARAIEDHRNQSGNIFSFDWSFDLTVATQPRLLHRDKSNPLYEVKQKP
ncbi:MAG: hypothetical protein U0931_23630 [Vulcanimicrobiota bacterium]